MPLAPKHQDFAASGLCWYHEGRFEELQKPRFAKRETTWALWLTLCYRVEFWRVDISCKSSSKHSESIQNCRIWQPLVFADMIREVSNSCKNIVWQRGGTTSAMWSPLCHRTNFDGLVSPANRLANNRNQRQTTGFGSLWPLLTWWGKFRRVAETSFGKGGGPYGSCGSPFPIGANFDVRIFLANRVENNRPRGLTASLFFQILRRQKLTTILA